MNTEHHTRNREHPKQARSRRSRLSRLGWLALLIEAAFVRTCPAQSSSLFLSRDGHAEAATLAQASWTYAPVQTPKELRIHDLLTIRVDELSRMTSEGGVQRRKNTLYDAILSNWIILDGLRWVKPSPQSNGDPRVTGQTTQTYRAQSEMDTRESLSFNITAEIVDVRPNGTMVVEAHKRVRVNNDVWEYSLSGVCRKEDIGPDNVVLSRNLSDLNVFKRERGHVRDGYRRGWFTRWLDELQPF